MDEQNATETSIEQIWLTPDSSIQFWLALFVMVTLVGLFLWWPIAVGAGAIALSLVFRWVRTARRETSELPLR